MYWLILEASTDQFDDENEASAVFAEERHRSGTPLQTHTFERHSLKKYKRERYFLTISCEVLTCSSWTQMEWNLEYSCTCSWNTSSSSSSTDVMFSSRGGSPSFKTTTKTTRDLFTAIIFASIWQVHTTFSIAACSSRRSDS